MGLFSFVGDIVQDVFGGSKSRSESAQYNAQAMAQQQAYTQQNMETQQGYNLQNMAVQQRYNLQNMALQNQYNIEAFNRENEYNSPLQQRLRAQAAGINQNWQDGAGVVAQQDSGVSSAVPSGAMPSASPGGVPGVSSSLADPSSLLEGIMHLSRFNKEQKLLDAQILKTKNEAGLIGSQDTAQQLANSLTKLYGAKNAQAVIDDLLANARHNNASADEINYLKEARNLVLSAQSLYYESGANLNEAHERKTLKEEEYIPIASAQKDRELNIQQQNADTNVYQSRTDRARQQEEVRTHKANEAISRDQVKVNDFAVRSQDRLNKLIGELTELQSKGQKLENIHQKLDNGLDAIQYSLENWAYQSGLSKSEVRLRIKEAKSRIQELRGRMFETFDEHWFSNAHDYERNYKTYDAAKDKYIQDIYDIVHDVFDVDD